METGLKEVTNLLVLSFPDRYPLCTTRGCKFLPHPSAALTKEGGLEIRYFWAIQKQGKLSESVFSLYHADKKCYNEPQLTTNNFLCAVLSAMDVYI